MLGFPVVSSSVIEYDNSTYHLCAMITGAFFTTTTEVYPGSAQTSFVQPVSIGGHSGVLDRKGIQV